MKQILIIGATGAMGRYVIKHLKGWQARAFTRNSQSPIAQNLIKEVPGTELYQGNSNSREDLSQALEGMDALFINTDFWSNTDNPDNERQQMLTLLKLAQQQNIAHVILSSLENCMTESNGNTPVTHFDAKAIVEQEINWQRSLEHFHKSPGFYSRQVTVLRTLPYFENLMSFFPPQQIEESGDSVFEFSLPIGDQPFSMVALDDIGWFVNHILHHPDKFSGQTLAIGSEALTGAEIAAQFTEVTGKQAIYNPISDDTFLQAGGFAHDALNHFRFHRDFGMARDYSQLKTIHPELLSFKSWLQKTGWQGESRLVQKKLAE